VEKISSSSLVVKGNDLIISRYNLSLAEQRLILQVVSMINKDDEDFKDYYVSISDYLDLVGSNSNNYYQVKKFTEELLKKPLHIPLQDGNFLACNWFSSIVYLSEKGVIVCRFDPHLKPYLLQLKNRFTAYRLENVLKLKNKYLIRLYEILKRYENIREKEISLDNFKKYLSIPDTYLYGDIKKRILKPAQKEFKERTDIIFDFQEIKEFKKVVAIKFLIYLNQSNNNSSINIIDNTGNNQILYNTPQTPPQYEQYIQNQDAQISKSNNSNNNISETLQNLLLLVPEDARTINLKNYLERALEHHDEKYIKSQIEYVNHQKKVSNYKAYLAKAIEEDYADIEKIKLEEKAQIIKNKYRPQIDRIMSMNTKQTPIYKSKEGESYYLSSIQFSENELIIYHDIKKDDDEFGPYSAAPYVIPLDNERAIASNLKQIEEILSSKKEKSQEINQETQS
jgi:plasmid replication initiation protein